MTLKNRNFRKYKFDCLIVCNNKLGNNTSEPQMGSDIISKQNNN